MKKRNILLLITVILFCSLFFISINKVKFPNHLTPLIGKASYSSKIGRLIIKKIQLNQVLHRIDSENNQVDKSVTILHHDEQITILASHSGNAPNAYFERLEELTTGDLIELELYQKKTNYLVDKIEIAKKTGSIRFRKPDKETLVLTTCGRENDTQLIILAIKKD